MAEFLLALGWAADASGRWGPVVALLARGTVLLLVVLLLVLALRRYTPGLRHLLWSGGLVGLLLLPVLGPSLPPLRVLPWRATSTPTVLVPSVPATPIVGVTPATPATAHSGAPAAPATGTATAPEARGPAAPQGASCPGCAGESGIASTPGVPRGVWLLGLWLAGVALLLGRMLHGALALGRIVRRGELLDVPEWNRPLYEAADIIGLTDAPRLVMSDEVQLPFTAGVLRPVVVVPRSAASWSDDRRRAVLSHELAHVRRRDLIVHLLGRLACALYWFHPLVWLAAKRAREEGERACDDLVLTTGARASAYADHLLQIVCAAARTSAPVVAIPMAQRTSFEGRMLAILEPEARRAGPGRLQALAAVGGLTALLVTVAAAAPEASRISPSGSVAGRAVKAERSEEAAARVHGVPGRLALPETTTTKKALAAPQDTDRARRGQHEDGLSETVSRTVTQTLNNMNVSIEQATSQAFDGGGRITPTPMPMPMPVVMIFDGPRTGPPHRAGHHRARKSADPRVLAALIQALTDEQAEVRAHAAYSLGELGDAKAVAALSTRLRSDENAEVRRMAAWSLAEIDDEQGAGALATALADRDVGVRRMAAFGLGNIECGGQESALGEALARDADAELRYSAAWALGQCSATPAEPFLARALTDAAPRVRRAAAWALGELEVSTAPPALMAALRDPDVEMRRTAAWALGEIGDERASAALTAALRDANADVRKTALWALGQTGGEAARDALLQAIKSDDPTIRRYAAQALAEIR